MDDELMMVMMMMIIMEQSSLIAINACCLVGIGIPIIHHFFSFLLTSNRSRLPKYPYTKHVISYVPSCSTMPTTVTALREIAVPVLEGVGWDGNRRSCDDAINPGSLMSPPPPTDSVAGIPPPASLAARSSASAHDVTSSGSDGWAARKPICNLPVSFCVFQLSEKLRTSVVIIS